MRVGFRHCYLFPVVETLRRPSASEQHLFHRNEEAQTQRPVRSVCVYMCVCVCACVKKEKLSTRKQVVRRRNKSSGVDFSSARRASRREVRQTVRRSLARSACSSEPDRLLIVHRDPGLLHEAELPTFCISWLPAGRQAGRQAHRLTDWLASWRAGTPTSCVGVTSCPTLRDVPARERVTDTQTPVRLRFALGMGSSWDMNSTPYTAAPRRATAVSRGLF